MDSHSFSEPRWLSQLSRLTWEVDVLRRGQVVDTLQVTADNFPPRLNKKKKIVWQLPSQADQLPRFGEHEKGRLWELFKQQKKDRRKKAKQGQDMSTNGIDKSESLRCEDDPAVTDSKTDTPQRQQRAESFEARQLRKEEKIADEDIPHRDVNDVDKAEANAKVDNSIQIQLPPPPGFIPSSGGSKSPSTGQKQSEGDPPRQQHDEQPQEQHRRPPSKLAASKLQSTAPQSRAISTSPPTPAVVTASFSNTSALGAQVATAFIESLTKQRIELWLSFFLPGAASTLLVGQAQAVCSTPVERRQQWQALQQPYWECHGWTQQSSVASAILLVFTGRTIQPTGPFSYSLTLLLTDELQIYNSVLSLSLLGQAQVQ